MERKTKGKETAKAKAEEQLRRIGKRKWTNQHPNNDYGKAKTKPPCVVTLALRPGTSRYCRPPRAHRVQGIWEKDDDYDQYDEADYANDDEWRGWDHDESYGYGWSDGYCD